jgi:hypothetical protein
MSLTLIQPCTQSVSVLVTLDPRDSIDPKQLLHQQYLEPKVDILRRVSSRLSVKRRGDGLERSPNGEAELVGSKIAWSMGRRNTDGSSREPT